MKLISTYKSAYVVAKHGVADLTKSVALEVAEQGMTENAVCSGCVWTTLVEKLIPESAKNPRHDSGRGVSKRVVCRATRQKIVTVELVAALASFLANQEAASITGAVIPMDSGWTSH